MSKNDMVMVPSVPTDEMIVAFAEAWYSKRQTIDDPDMLDAYAAMLAVAPEQRRDPVALPERKPEVGTDPFGNKGWNACLDEIAKLGPLFSLPVQAEPVAWVRFRNGEPDYDGDACMIMNVPGDTFGDGDSWEAVYTHPDTRVAGYALAMREKSKEHVSEVSALRAELDETQRISREEELRANHYSAQLAEAHALLREVHGGMWPSNPLTIKIGSHLSASAEPSAPKCGNCGSGTGQACNDKGCGYLESGNGEPSAPVEIDERAEITLEQVLRAYEYAERHPHRYLRGTTNWCAAVAHSLNKQASATMEQKS